jgi:aspartyl-tRNA synthetase
MWDQGFQEFQTPLLTASSPEGARDFLVPSRLHAGKAYALPQAPQQFKQLLMVSGFDRYFQIAPCFRDEDGRADRLAEFYQLDVEMSFITEEDVFATMEPVIGGIFSEFASYLGTARHVTPWPWVRIPYQTAMLEYGSDKPDLRNPLKIVDVTAIFARADVDFKAFRSVIDKGGVVRAIRAPKIQDRPRSFFDKLNDWAKGEGAPGLGYVVFEGTEGKGPIAKFLSADALAQLCMATGAGDGDAVFFVCDQIYLKKISSNYAGSPIFPCMNATRKPERLISPITHSRCPRAGWTPLIQKILWKLWPINMIASVMVSNCVQGQSATIAAISWHAPLKLPAIAKMIWPKNLVAC